MTNDAAPVGVHPDPAPALDFNAWWRATFDPSGTLAAPRQPEATHRFERRHEALRDYTWWKVVRPAAAGRVRLRLALLDFLWRVVGRRVTTTGIAQNVLERLAGRLERPTAPAEPLRATPISRMAPPAAADRRREWRLSLGTSGR